jgi:hypothetical protein
MYFPDEPDSNSLVMADAIERIADLEDQLQQASLREEHHISEISHLRDELTNTIMVLHACETVLDQYSSHFGAVSNPPSLSRTQPVHSPFKLPTSTLKSLTKFPKVDPSLFPHPFDPNESPLNLSQRSVTLTTPQLPKAVRTYSKSKSPAITTVLGANTQNFLNAHDLTYLSSKLETLIQTTAPPQWNATLRACHLLDKIHFQLMEALTANWVGNAEISD